MKKICFTLAVILCLGALSACSGIGSGGETVQGSGAGPGGMAGQNGAETGNPGGNGVYDIFSDKKQVIQVEEKDLKGILKGVQFYQGKPVMLSAEFNYGGDKTTANIWLYSPDEDARLIARGLPDEVNRGAGFCFLDEEGCFYHVKGGSGASADTVITKYDGSGKKAYAIERNASSLQMCSLSAGKIALFYRDSIEGNDVLEILDTATGAVLEVKLQGRLEYNVYLGTDGTVPCLLDSYGVSSVDPEEGEVTRQLRFGGSSYGLNLSASDREKKSICTFRVGENGDVEILWGRMFTPGFAAPLKLPPGEVCLETLQKREIEGNKTFLTIRGLWDPDDWLKEKIAEFNGRSRDYYVLVEIAGDEVSSEEDYINQTLVELGTGKGPDILYGDVLLGTSLYDLAGKGAFEDLAPYMERSGMKREDYFPLAFCDYQNEGKVYGILTNVKVFTQTVDRSLLESADGVDVNVFLDALLALGDEAVYQKNADSGELLQRFLQGSENLWGMVDWERGTCNFDTDLFAKLLQAAKNLGDSGKKNYTPVSERVFVGLGTIPYLYSQESGGKTDLGMLFDGGCYGQVRANFSLKVNANSQNKEGVWEFLNYLLSREAQETQDSPVHREAFAARAEDIIAEHARFGLSRYPNPLTRELAEELEAYLMEDVRFLPICVQPLIDIIKEEASDYFEGIKDIGQVRNVVKNRVQLYLDEKF